MSAAFTAVLPHLAILQVVIPLIAAILAGFLGSGRLAFALTLVVSLVLPFIAGGLLWQVLATGPISYHIGGWEPPFGIEYRIDLLNAFVLMLITTVGAVIAPFAARSVASEVDDDKQGWFYCMYLLCLAGLLGITATGDAFNAFVFLEISSLSTYAMIAMGRDRRALVAAYQYLIMGTIGATFYIIGVGILYLLTGSLNLFDIGGRLAAVPADQAPGPVLPRWLSSPSASRSSWRCSRCTPGCRTPMPMRRPGRPPFLPPPRPRSRSICSSATTTRCSAARWISAICRSTTSSSCCRSRRCSWPR